MNSVEKTTEKVAAGVLLMVVAGLGPWIVLSIAGLPNIANASILPSIALTIACVTGSGWRSGILVVGPFAVLAGLAMWASPIAWLAAIVLAIAAFLRGYAARVGMHDALVVTVINLGFLVALPPTFEVALPDPLVVALVSLGSGLWVTLVMFVLRKRFPHVPRTRVNEIRVIVFSSALALLVGLVTFFVVLYDLGQTGGWIILTVLVVFQPDLGSGVKKAGSRAVGTVAGFGITIAVGLIVPTGSILYVLGAVFIVITFLFILQKRPYWMYAMALTPGVVLLDSATSRVGVVAMERLKATGVGIALTLLVILALLPLAKYLRARPSSET